MKTIYLFFVLLFTLSVSTPAYAHTGHELAEPAMEQAHIGAYVVDVHLINIINQWEMSVIPTMPNGDALPADARVTVTIRDRESNKITVEMEAKRDEEHFTVQIPLPEGQWQASAEITSSEGDGHLTVYTSPVNKRADAPSQWVFIGYGSVALIVLLSAISFFRIRKIPLFQPVQGI